MTTRPTPEAVYQAWHGTTEDWGGCADGERIARVLALFADEADLLRAQLRRANDLHTSARNLNNRYAAAFGAIRDDFADRGARLEERGNNGSIRSHEAAGRGEGYREAARKMTDALNDVRVRGLEHTEPASQPHLLGDLAEVRRIVMASLDGDPRHAGPAALRMILSVVNPALSLNCSTCGGTGLVDWEPGAHRDSEDDQQPCPDCPAGETNARTVGRRA